MKKYDYYSLFSILDKGQHVTIVSWNSAGGIYKFQDAVVLGQVGTTIFCIVVGHEDDIKSGNWFDIGEIVYFEAVDFWKLESAVFYGDVK